MSLPCQQFHFSLCVNFHQVCCAAYLLHPSFGSSKPSGKNTQDKSAEFSNKQTGRGASKQKYDIQLLFKIKHSVLTPAHKSKKKRQTLAPPLILQFGNTYNCGRKWLCDYRWNSSASQHQLSCFMFLDNVDHCITASIIPVNSYAPSCFRKLTSLMLCTFEPFTPIWHHSWCDPLVSNMALGKSICWSLHHFWGWNRLADGSLIPQHFQLCLLQVNVLTYPVISYHKKLYRLLLFDKINLNVFGGMVAQWLAPRHHSKKVSDSTQGFLCEEYMFSSCLHGFSMGPMASSHSPKTWKLGSELPIDANNVGVNDYLSLYVSPEMN